VKADPGAAPGMRSGAAGAPEGPSAASAEQPDGAAGAGAPVHPLRALLRVVGVLATRDLVRMGRQPARMLGALLAPVVILAFWGAAAESILRAGDVYRKFLLAGMLVQAMLFSAQTSGAALIQDREAGLLRTLALAPVPRGWVALGKVLGAGAQAVAHGLVFLFAAPMVDAWPTPLGFAAALGVLLALGVGLGGLTLAVASRARTFEDFGAAMLLVSIPALFVSGVHFPTAEFPPWLRALARANPLTYAIDALKHVFVPVTDAGRWSPDFAPGTDALALVAFAVAGAWLGLRHVRLGPARG
jgi:ABC-2 type transport system permease protein